MRTMRKFLFFAVTVIALPIFTDAQHVSAQETGNRYRGADLILETGGFKGIDAFRTNGLSPVTVAGGYTFNKHLFLGVGMSLTLYPDYERGSIPVFIRIKSALSKSKVSPYIQFDAGCNIPTFPSPTCKNETIEGKPGFLFLRPEIGMQLRLHKRKAVHFGIGCMINDGTYSKYTYGGGCIPDYTVANASLALTFTAGFTF